MPIVLMDNKVLSSVDSLLFSLANAVILLS